VRHARKFSGFASSWVKNEAYIGGRWVGATSKATFPVQDPGNGAMLGDVPDMSAEDCKLAIDAAQAAGPSFARTSAQERHDMLSAICRFHKENIDELAKILAMESGKTFEDAKGEIKYGAGYFEWFAEEAKREYGDIIPGPDANKKIFVSREPVGICGLITPWNFPNAMIARKLAAALAAGCTSVVKPAAETPFSTLAIALMCEKAGVPAGVVNVVTADNARAAEIGAALTEDERVRKISFTGSTRVGKLLMTQSAQTVKKTSMELGGNAPFIVFDDADLAKAASGYKAAKHRNCGQTCVSPNRIFVQSGVHDEFSKMLVEAAESLKVGWCLDEGVSIGPLINEAAVDKVDALVQDAVSKGAKVLAGGKRLPELGPNFYAPTILGNCDSTMQIASEEIFGPVSPIFKFETEEEVIRTANSVDAGLASYFFSRDLARVFRVSRSIEAGMVAVNTGMLSNPVAPFGGVKQSGLGREGSKYGLEDYTELKYVLLDTSE